MSVQIEYGGVTSPAVLLRVYGSVPALFTVDNSGGGQGAILNPDGSVNSSANPAAAGDTVVLFGTGGGDTDPPGRDGLFAVSGPPWVS